MYKEILNSILNDLQSVSKIEGIPSEFEEEANDIITRAKLAIEAYEREIKSNNKQPNKKEIDYSFWYKVVSDAIKIAIKIFKQDSS